MRTRAGTRLQRCHPVDARPHALQSLSRSSRPISPPPAEKLEYNYRVLSERDHESKASLAAHRARLSRLRGALDATRAERAATDARLAARNTALSTDFQRVARQYRELQDKFRAFEASDAAKYADLAALHTDELGGLVARLRDAEAAIAARLLGRPQPHPSQPAPGSCGALPLPPLLGGSGSEDDPLAAAVDEAAAMLGEPTPAPGEPSPPLAEGAPRPWVPLLPAATIGGSSASASTAGSAEPPPPLPRTVRAKLRGVLDAVAERCGALLLDTHATVHVSALRNAGRHADARAFAAAAVLSAVGCTTPDAAASLVAAFDAAVAAVPADDDVDVDAADATAPTASDTAANRGWVVVGEDPLPCGAALCRGDGAAAGGSAGSATSWGAQLRSAPLLALPHGVPIAEVLNRWRESGGGGGGSRCGASDRRPSIGAVGGASSLAASAALLDPGGAASAPVASSSLQWQQLSGSPLLPPAAAGDASLPQRLHHPQSAALATVGEQHAEAAHWRAFADGAVPPQTVRLWGALDAGLGQLREALLARADACAEVSALRAANARRRAQLRQALGDPLNARLLESPVLAVQAVAWGSGGGPGGETARASEGEGGAAPTSWQHEPPFLQQMGGGRRGSGSGSSSSSGRTGIPTTTARHCTAFAARVARPRRRSTGAACDTEGLLGSPVAGDGGGPPSGGLAVIGKGVCGAAGL